MWVDAQGTSKTINKSEKIKILTKFRSTLDELRKKMIAYDQTLYALFQTSSMYAPKPLDSVSTKTSKFFKSFTNIKK